MKPIRPMLATLAPEVPRGPQWIFEEKYDGIRALAYRRKGKVRLWSRNLLDLSAGFPAVGAAVASLPGGDLVLDGELVVFDPKGVSRFQLLQRRGSGGQAAYVVFDLLERDGAALLTRPLRERRAYLEEAIVPSTGPASPTRASAAASLPIDFAEITAPRKGTNIGAEAFIPSRRSWITCPVSCSRRRTTKPTANGKPKRSP